MIRPTVVGVIKSAPKRNVAVAAVAVFALFASGPALAGCAIIKKAKTVASTVETNKKTIDTFSSKLKDAAATPFEATYVTGGSSPTTVVYAVQPPKGLAFTETQTSAGSASSGTPNVDIIVNQQGEYACTPPASGGNWSCDALAPEAATAQNAIFDFYTPSHWVNLLAGFSLAAGVAGDKVTSSNMTVNGFSMSCVNFAAPGDPGTSTVCTTSQGILGYAKVAGDTTTFALKAYTASPPASLFQLPAGATVTQLQLPSAAASS
jgi:outer membrane murein-binding lipoprotein Lpp